MDVFIDPLDHYVLTPYVYSPEWKEQDVERQALTVFSVLVLGGVALYFFFGTIAYVFLFDKELRKHPFFLKDQEWTEIGYALYAIPWMAVYSTPIFVAELRGHSKLYDSIEEKGIQQLAISVLLFFAWNDFAVYWVHRGLHLPIFYKRIHKTHHLFKVHTPFASLAFTPMDGFSQSLPYHIFVFCIPMHKLTYLMSFVAIQMWTVFIHDHYYLIPEWLDYYVNGSKHHTDHHMFFDYNFGLYFTLWDRIGGTHRNPSANMGNGPKDQLRRFQLEEESKQKAN
jgi:lathosterol oxidase